jgi:hypothetical protein
MRRCASRSSMAATRCLSTAARSADLMTGGNAVQQQQQQPVSTAVCSPTHPAHTGCWPPSPPPLPAASDASLTLASLSLRAARSGCAPATRATRGAQPAGQQALQRGTHHTRVCWFTRPLSGCHPPWLLLMAHGPHAHSPWGRTAGRRRAPPRAAARSARLHGPFLSTSSIGCRLRRCPPAPLRSRGSAAVCMRPQPLPNESDGAAGGWGRGWAAAEQQCCSSLPCQPHLEAPHERRHGAEVTAAAVNWPMPGPPMCLPC